MSIDAVLAMRYPRYSTRSVIDVTGFVLRTYHKTVNGNHIGPTRPVGLPPPDE